MPPRAEEERIQRSHDPGGAFFVRLNSFAFSFRHLKKNRRRLVVLSKTPEKSLAQNALPREKKRKRKTRLQKKELLSRRLFVVADRCDISIQKVLLQKKISRLSQKKKAHY